MSGGGGAPSKAPPDFIRGIPHYPLVVGTLIHTRVQNRRTAFKAPDGHLVQAGITTLTDCNPNPAPLWHAILANNHMPADRGNVASL
jgi:hypothetical protein